MKLVRLANNEPHRPGNESGEDCARQRRRVVNLAATQHPWLVFWKPLKSEHEQSVIVVGIAADMAIERAKSEVWACKHGRDHRAERMPDRPRRDIA